MSHAPSAIGKPRTLLAAVIGTAIAYIGVLDSHRLLYTARQTLVGVKLSRLQNLVTLAGVGGGWSEHSAQNAGPRELI
jgi:outer membrane protein TolC